MLQSNDCDSSTRSWFQSEKQKKKSPKSMQQRNLSVVVVGVALFVWEFKMCGVRFECRATDYRTLIGIFVKIGWVCWFVWWKMAHNFKVKPFKRTECRFKMKMCLITIAKFYFAESCVIKLRFSTFSLSLHSTKWQVATVVKKVIKASPSLLIFNYT